MDTPGRPTLYKPECCELAHNCCLLGDDLAALDAAGESLRHAAE